MTLDPPRSDSAVETRNGRLGGALDVLLAGASATVVTVSGFVASEPDTQSSTVAAYILGIVMGGLLLFRRQQPVLVLALSLAAVMIYNLTKFPSVSPTWLLLIPLYTVARNGHLWIGAAVGSSTMLISVGWILQSGGQSLELLDDLLRETFALAAVLLAGTAIHNKELFARVFAARLAAERQHQEREAHRRVLEERLRIARELHDVTAHTVAVVGIQISLARELVEEDPVAAREMLENTRRINMEAIHELQAAVRLLRDGAASPEPQLHSVPNEWQIEELLERIVESGVRAEFRREGEVRPVPHVAGLTLYRIAQESLTNVLRHADAEHVQVTLRYEPDGVVLDVVNDVREPLAGGRQSAAAQPEGTGYGVTGMRERAISMGGTLDAGPAPGGGFTVRARLPLTGEAPHPDSASGPAAHPRPAAVHRPPPGDQETLSR